MFNILAEEKLIMKTLRLTKELNNKRLNSNIIWSTEKLKKFDNFNTSTEIITN
jgi:hypothetical protein